MRDLALAPWACWRGRFGHRSWTAGDVLGEGPQSPLWQQTFDDRPAEPCEVVAEDPGRPKDADEAEPDAAADELRKAAGRLEWLFDECSDWEKPPATGTYLVACDQASLGDFFDSGLDDEKAATVQITGLGFEAAAPMVPAVWRAPDVQNFEKPVIRATPRASLQIYAVCPAADGRQVEASFEDVRLRAGGTATIDDSNPSRWRLLGTDGKEVAWDTPNRIDYARTDGRPARGPEISARCQR